ncbi:ATP-grasp domain-containing protein, partial [Mangrovimonas sp. AS39]|uniref:ATP-grasp domain-containing protein n=1 Tax=Mangrovimonas futianensis TaxID=2895523 RepID=UPI001E43723E
IPSGSIKFVNWFFKAQELSYPPALDYPTELLPYLNRQVLRTTLSTLLASWGPNGPSSPLFIKPVIQKAFTGFVLQPEGWVTQLSDIDPNQEVWTSEVIPDIQSEWRVFVLDKRILDIRPYRQTFSDYLNFMPSEVALLNEMIEAFTSAPRSYSLDIALALEWVKGCGQY